MIPRLPNQTLEAYPMARTEFLHERIESCMIEARTKANLVQQRVTNEETRIQHRRSRRRSLEDTVDDEWVQGIRNSFAQARKRKTNIL
jgi:hypothetical protein